MLHAARLLQALGLGLTLSSAAHGVLGPIEITKSRIADEAEDLPANVSTLTAEEIERRPGRTLPDLLRQETSVQVRELYGNNAAAATVDIRGFGAAAASNTLILIDGRRLNEVDLAPVEFNLIPLGNIERVEILRGAGPVLYGDGAVGGVINVVTKQAQARGTQGRVRGTIGSYETVSGEAQLAHGGEAGSAYGFVRYYDADGYRDNNDLNEWNVNLDLRRSFGATDGFLRFAGTRQALRLPGPRTVDPGAGLDELADDRRGTSRPNDFADTRSAQVTTGLTREALGGEALADLGVRLREQEFFFDFGGGFSSFTRTDLTTWSLTPRYELPRSLLDGPGKLVIGVDAYYSDYTADRSLVPEEIDQPIHRMEVSQWTVGLYGHHSHWLDPDSLVVAGLRWQRLALSARDRFDPTAPGAGTEVGAAPLDQADAQWMAELGARHRASEAVSLYANLARSVRFAKIDEIFVQSFDPASFALLNAFAPLDPQVGHTVDVGTDIRLGAHDLHLGGFFGRYRDEIQFDPIEFTSVNLDPTQRFGIELSAELRLAEGFSLQPRYTFTRATFTDGPFSGNQVPLVPEHSAGVVAAWAMTDWADLVATLDYVGQRRLDNDQANTFEMIPAYTLVGIKLSGRWAGWDLAAQVNNLFDERAVSYAARSTVDPNRFAAYPLPERNVLLTIGRRF